MKIFRSASFWEVVLLGMHIAVQALWLVMLLLAGSMILEKALA